MLPVLLSYSAEVASGLLARALTSMLHQTPRQLLVAVVVIVAVVVDFVIPLLALGCLSYGGCPILHP